MKICISLFLKNKSKKAQKRSENDQLLVNYLKHFQILKISLPI